MDRLRIQFTKFRHPVPDVRAFRVKTLLLSPAIKNPEIGLGITTCRRGPLPVTVIDSRIKINEIASKMSFTPAPVNLQVFCEKRCHHHSHTIVHVSRCLQFPHAGIHDRKASSSFYPGLEMLGRIQPGQAVITGPEISTVDMRKVPADMVIKISPVELAPESFWLLKLPGPAINLSW